jgi:hypothetical protein
MAVLVAHHHHRHHHYWPTLQVIRHKNSCLHKWYMVSTLLCHSMSYVSSFVNRCKAFHRMMTKMTNQPKNTTSQQPPNGQRPLHQKIQYNLISNLRSSTFSMYKQSVTRYCTFSLAQLCIGRDRAARWIGQCHSITNSAWPNANTFATSVGSTATQHQNRGVARQEESMYTTRREQPSSANATLWSW